MRCGTEPDFPQECFAGVYSRWEAPPSPRRPSAPRIKSSGKYLLWKEEKRVEGGGFCPALWDAKSEQSRGREEGKSVKLLPVLSVAIAASQCPRDIWHLVLNRRFFPYIIRYKNSWGTRDFDHMTHNTFLPLKQNRTKLRGFKKRVLKATFPLWKNISTLHPRSLLLVFHECLCKVAN